MSDMTSRSNDANLSRRDLLAGAGAAGVALTAGCLGDESTGEGAAWIYFAEVGDLGWTFAHNEGYEGTVDMMDDIETSVVEDVDPADVEQTAAEFAEDGYDVVFGASADYTDGMAAASEQYPDTAFEVASGIETGDNHGAYYTKLYQARYLVGYAAGLVTETDNIGYVAANPVSTVYQDINGFASGLADSNEDATVYVQWTNDWFDPATEGENAQTVIDSEDVDVMAQHQDSPSALETAADNEIWGSGYAASMQDQIDEEYYLMTPVFEWEEVYARIIEEVQDGEWEAGITFPDIGEGADISDPGPAVPDDVVDEVMSIRDDMLEGDADEIVWSDTPYEGRSDEEILFESDDFELDNIEGEVL